MGFEGSLMYIHVVGGGFIFSCSVFVLYLVLRVIVIMIIFFSSLHSVYKIKSVCFIYSSFIYSRNLNRHIHLQGNAQLVHTTHTDMVFFSKLTNLSEKYIYVCIIYGTV